MKHLFRKLLQCKDEVIIKCVQIPIHFFKISFIWKYLGSVFIGIVSSNKGTGVDGFGVWIRFLRPFQIPDPGV